MMRDKIVELLRDRAPEPVSGASMAELLQVSRTAIWKHMRVLEQEGYVIEAINKRGYVLKEVPNRLYSREVQATLTTQWLGHNIVYNESVDSTNQVAKKMAAQEAPNGTVCVAEEQVGGRGRLSRGWFSPYGKGIWCSILLKPTCMPEEASKFTLLAAVAVVQAVNEYKGVKAGIKWPNDILLEGKKLVGILTEMSAQFGHINYIVVGVGINTHVEEEIMPEEFRGSATCVQDIAEEPVVRAELLAKMLNHFEELYEQVEAHGFESIFGLWREYSCTLGQMVKVISPDKTYEGEAIDINEDGMLMVRKDDGTMETVVAGDVSIRPVKPTKGKYQ